ncbi:MAG: YgeY family selenium metabolism-linked hydrolase [Candidatus Bathyarchaeia archaeon]
MDELDGHLEQLRKAEPRMLEFLKALIRTPSLSGDEGRVAELVEREMEGLGYEVEVDGMGNVVGRRGGGGRAVLFDAHMDHIDAGSPGSWSHDPYAAEVVDGVLYGRGSVDMKGALAAMIYGCAAPRNQGEVVVACVVHEETNEGVATRRILEEGGLRPDACVLGEPTDLDLSIGQRGRCVVKIATRGVTSHASMPELGRNALYEMTPIIDAVKEANRRLPRHPFLGAGSMAVTNITCRPGAGPIIPDLCEILVDRRLIPEETLDGVLEELRGLAAGAEVELVADDLTCYTGYRTRVEQYFPGWITDRGRWPVEECLRALEEVLGRRPAIIGWRFSTDGVATAGDLGIPTVGFGPGDPSLAHQPDEHVALSDVAAAARGYCALAHRLTAS